MKEKYYLLFAAHLLLASSLFGLWMESFWAGAFMLLILVGPFVRLWSTGDDD